MVDDSLLTERLLDKSTRRQAFSKMVSQYSEQLYWHIRRIVLTHEDADDVLQNVFVKVWTGIDNFRGDCKLSSWLYRIAVNEAIDFTRKRGTSSIDTAEDGMTMADRLMADEYFDGDETEAMLYQAINELPEVQRKVFHMKYFDDMKYSEISEITGTSEGALKASYHIAVKKIEAFFHKKD